MPRLSTVRYSSRL